MLDSMNVVLDKGAYMPESAHDADAGYDIKTPISVTVAPSTPNNGNGYAVIDTGVHVAIPQGYVGFLKSKSGLNVKNSLTGEGVIDSGYTGSIVVKLYNHGNEEKHFNVGEKIIQLVILPILKPRLVLVESLEDTERGKNGFGSTGSM